MRGFSLIEVIVALLVLEVGVMGVAGSFLLASRLMTRAEVMEATVAAMEGVLDSLSGGASEGEGYVEHATGGVRWVVDSFGLVTLSAAGPDGTALLVVRGEVPLR